MGAQPRGGARAHGRGHRVLRADLWHPARRLVLPLRTSVHTRELLVEEGGFLYDSDAYNDDLPYYASVGDKRQLVVPYTMVYNDVKYAMPPGMASPTDFFDVCARGFDELLREGRGGHPRMMSIGLHPPVGGAGGADLGVARVHRARPAAVRRLVRHPRADRALLAREPPPRPGRLVRSGRPCHTALIEYFLYRLRRRGTTSTHTRRRGAARHERPSPAGAQGGRRGVDLRRARRGDAAGRLRRRRPQGRAPARRQLRSMAGTSTASRCSGRWCRATSGA